MATKPGTDDDRPAFNREFKESTTDDHPWAEKEPNEQATVRGYEPGEAPERVFVDYDSPRDVDDQAPDGEPFEYDEPRSDDEASQHNPPHTEGDRGAATGDGAVVTDSDDPDASVGDGGGPVDDSPADTSDDPADTSDDPADASGTPASDAERDDESDPATKSEEAATEPTAVAGKTDDRYEKKDDRDDGGDKEGGDKEGGGLTGEVSHDPDFQYQPPDSDDGGPLTGELTHSDERFEVPDDIVIQQAGAPEYPIDNGDGTVTLEDGSVIAVGDGNVAPGDDVDTDIDDAVTGDSNVGGDGSSDNDINTGDGSVVDDTDDDGDSDDDDSDDGDSDDGDSDESDASPTSFGSGSKPGADDGSATAGSSGGFGTGADEGSTPAPAIASTDGDLAFDDVKEPDAKSDVFDQIEEPTFIDEKGDFGIDMDEKDLDLDEVDDIELID